MFTSPDRFIEATSPTDDSFRSTRDPRQLSPRERYSRQRDQSVDPFRYPTESRGRQLVRRVAAHSPHPPRHIPSFVQGSDAAPVHIDANSIRETPRQISLGAVWTVGGASAAQGLPRAAISDGRGRLLGSGTNAPFHFANFLEEGTQEQELRRNENRLALALDIDQARRIIGPSSHLSPPNPESPTNGAPVNAPLLWRDSSWTRESGSRAHKREATSPARPVPSIPFRVLDAPRLRDDFYCSTLAYSHTSRVLAVGLMNQVFLWSEEQGVGNPPFALTRASNYVTSLSFSSAEGAHSILAVGRQGGSVSLWSPLEDRTRFEAQQPSPVSCLSFKPSTSRRPSTYLYGHDVACEDLLVGDDLGNIYYYSIEWPDPVLQGLKPFWPGSMTLIAKVFAHSQQICGIAWSPDGKYFATGANDNSALLFVISKVLDVHQTTRGRTCERQVHQSQPVVSPQTTSTPLVMSPPTPLASPERAYPPPNAHERDHDMQSASPARTRSDVALDIARRRPSAPRLLPWHNTDNLLTPPTSPTDRDLSNIPTHLHRPSANSNVLVHEAGLQIHTFQHSAAVKALAFASWQSSLLATGGGSNDRQIHFYHTGSGATLALISVFAQVTSLIWSQTKREIAATFGYAQPDHGVRIAVFEWPSGNCVVQIPWTMKTLETRAGVNLSTAGADCGRALWAIPYPGGPNDGARRGTKRHRDGDRGEGETWGSRTQKEGCIVVVGSDESVKFHEVWGGKGKKVAASKALGLSPGVLGGSKILEGYCEGIDVEEPEVIR